MAPTDESAAQCPVCGGPAEGVQISVDFWRGGVEPISIVACKDPTCDAYYPKAGRRTDVARAGIEPATFRFSDGVQA